MLLCGYRTGVWWHLSARKARVALPWAACTCTRGRGGAEEVNVRLGRRARSVFAMDFSFVGTALGGAGVECRTLSMNYRDGERRGCKAEPTDSCLPPNREHQSGVSVPVRSMLSFTGKMLRLPGEFSTCYLGIVPGGGGGGGGPPFLQHKLELQRTPVVADSRFGRAVELSPRCYERLLQVTSTVVCAFRRGRRPWPSSD